MTHKLVIECESCGRELQCQPDQAEIPCACGHTVERAAAQTSEQADLSAEDVAGKWYYEADSRRYGPVALRTLRKFVREGKLGPENLLWRRGMDAWTSVVDTPLVADSLPSEQTDETPTRVYEVPEPRRNPAPEHSEEGAAARESLALVRATSGLSYLLGGAMVVGIPVLLYFGIGGQVSALRTVLGTLALAFLGMMFLGVGQLLDLLCRMSARLGRLERKLESRRPRELL